MKQTYILLISFLLTVSSFTAYSQVKYSNEFLSIGVGARAMGMGGAVSGSTDDVTANYWNPAGLSRITSGLQISAMHTSWFSGVGNYDYIGIAKPIKNHTATIALGIIRFGIDNIPNTLGLLDPDGSINYDNIKPFSATDFAFFGSYARSLKDPKWKVGGSVKIVRRTIGNFANSIGFGIDAGVQHVGEKYFFGVMGKDITTTFNSWKGTFSAEDKEILAATGNEIIISGTEITRPTIILSAGINSNLGKHSGLLVELDLDATTDGRRNVLISANPVSVNPHLGVEYRYKTLFFLRGGINNIQQVIDETDNNKKNWTLQPNAGIGIDIGALRIDYALTNIGNVSETRLSHVFSLLLDLNPKPKSE